MSGLNAALFSATQALSTHSQALETAGKNLANVNNPAYARQRVILGDRGSLQIQGQTLGMGVQALGSQQIRDSLLDRRMTSETSTTAGLSNTQKILERAQAALGEQLTSSGDSSAVSSSTTSSGGISDAVSEFFNSFDSLAASPTDIGEKQLLLQKANVLAERINTADSRLAQVQTDATDQATTDVDSANDLLGQVAHLNQLIGVAENGNPSSALDLRDQRQAKLESLANYFNFDSTEVPGSHGQIDLTVRDSGGAAVTLVTGNSVTGAIGFDGTNFTGGASAAVLGLSSGSLPTGVAARDGTVQTARDGLQALATELKNSVNAAYSGNFFNPAPTGLISLQPGLTAANLKTTATANAGANELALAVARIANTIFSTSSGDAINGTPSAHFASVVSGLGHGLATANAQLEDQQLNQQAIGAMRDSVSGVNQDEELSDLMRYQRSFEASARFLNTVDSLLDLVVNRLGVG